MKPMPLHQQAWIALESWVERRDEELRELAQRAPRGERADLLSRAAELDEVREAMEACLAAEDE